MSKDGTRPSSNLDAFKLHAFYSNLPLYRKKYDWNVPAWTKEEIVALHRLVRAKIEGLLLLKTGAASKRLNFLRNERLPGLITRLSSRDLYLLYLNFDFERLGSRLDELLVGDRYPEFTDSATFFRWIAHAYRPHRPRFQGRDLAAFWNEVATGFNEALRGATSFKIATDCCLKFVNSRHDGTLVTDVSKADLVRIQWLLAKTDASQATER